MRMKNGSLKVALYKCLFLYQNVLSHFIIYYFFRSERNIRCTSSHEGKQLMNEVVPIHIDQLFTLLFTSSKFYLDFHAARKTTDLTQTPWTHNPLDNSKSRVVNLTVALNQAMGPKSAQVTETHVSYFCFITHFN